MHLPYDERKRQLLLAIADPVSGPFIRMQLNSIGSELRKEVAREVKVLAFSTATKNQQIIGPSNDAKAENRVFNIARGEAARLDEINFTWEQQSGADLTKINEIRLVPLMNGKTVDGVGELRLGDWELGTAGLKFGAIPVKQWLNPDENFEVVLKGPQDGADTIDFSVSLILRKEPSWLAEACGFVQPRGGR
ncbi:hypothetical protein OAU50_08425 [Planctomycetota bacterium]|nr:hypothetical protein [Planctomycetota bacterium]